jgi:hypothetical protein
MMRVANCIWPTLSWCLLFLVALLPTGCSKSNAEMGLVTGQVMLDGKPLSQADVTFQPDNQKPPSVGRTGPDGRYELGYKRGVQGALVGEHTVRILIPPGIAPGPQKVPARYNAQSELRREVKPGDNVFDFDLKTTPK